MKVEARCFGGPKDGEWWPTTGFYRLQVPVPGKMVFGPPDLFPRLKTVEYRLAKFAMAYDLPRDEPILFYAWIGPGFNEKMVEEWLKMWDEEAERLNKQQEGEEDMRDGDKARAEIRRMEMKIKSLVRIQSDLEAGLASARRMRRSAERARDEARGAHTLAEQKYEEEHRLRNEQINDFMRRLDAATAERDEAERKYEEEHRLRNEQFNDFMRRLDQAKDERDRYKKLAKIRLEALLLRD